MEAGTENPEKRVTSRWRPYNGKGLPCPPKMYVDVCEGRDDVYMDLRAEQAFDRSITHWRPTILRPEQEHSA